MTSNGQSIENLKPESVWRYFAGIMAVPRPSKQEQQIRKHILEIARSHNFTVRDEPIGNIIIEVPATPGFESAPITVIQGHLDMVCEKNADTQHDFLNDPIQPVIEQSDDGGIILRAKGTTLGADNGIGVAMALAAATEKDVVHGPLELLFTIDEEAGMSGAKALKPDSFKGRRLLNLDSEEDTNIYIGCAGGCDTNMIWSFQRDEPAPTGEFVTVSVNGLRGGHSGGDIHEGRGSAIKLLTRVLRHADLKTLRLAEIDGGNLRNALPREAQAIIQVDSANRKALRSAAQIVAEEARRESHEAKVRIEVTDCKDTPTHVLSPADTMRLLHALAALPHGVLGMHPKVPGLVETSNNIATVKAETAKGSDELAIQIGTLSRSSSASRMRELLDQIGAIGALSGATWKFENEYPGWEPDPESPLLKTCAKLYEEQFGEPPNVAAIHAGLECGIIGQRVGGMDMVSFGPRIEGAHSPDERVYVDSVAKIWGYLKVVLAELARDK